MTCPLKLMLLSFSCFSPVGCRLPGWHAEDRSDVYLVCNQKGGKKIGVKARGKAGGEMQSSDKGTFGVVKIVQCLQI